MSLRRFFDQIFSPGSGRRAGDKQPRYDNVRVINMADGTEITGHDAVAAHFEREKELLEAYGPKIMFQVHRINLQAPAIDQLVGERLAEITVDGDFVSGTDTVAAVKAKVRPLLEEEARTGRAGGAQPGFTIEEADRFTLFFNGRPMQDARLFYADHFMMLPAWVQVHLHGCEFDEVMELAAQLRKQGQE